MKTKAFKKALRNLCAVPLIACVLTCLKPVVGFTAYSYPNAAKYAAGDTEISKKVSALDVEWVSGRVSIVYHSDNTVELKETSKQKISDDMRMRWWLDGETLHVRFAKPGFRQISVQQKDLTITLPEDIELTNVSIQATSADIIIPFLKTDSLKLDVTSGDITATAEAGTVSSAATSGNLDLTVTGKVKEISAGASSGTIEIQAETADRLTAKSTSGCIRVKAKSLGEFLASSTSGDISIETGKAKRVSVSSTSGRVDAEADRFEALSITATSGDVTVSLPENPGFTAKLSTASGDIRCDLPLTKQGSLYVCGNGSGELSISTTSGDIVVN